jgi:hypothetical protein
VSRPSLEDVYLELTAEAAVEPVARADADAEGASR